MRQNIFQRKEVMGRKKQISQKVRIKKTEKPETKGFLNLEILFGEEA